MRPDTCTCPRESDDLCIGGTYYTYCANEMCGGACEPEGLCGCLHHGGVEHDSLTWPSDAYGVRPWGVDGDRTHCAKRVPPFHAWRKAGKGRLWFCTACMWGTMAPPLVP